MYNRYDRYLLEYPNTADDFLNLFYFALVMIIVVVGLVIFFGIIDYTVKNKDKYLILKDDTLLIPNAITNKVKVINLTDIDNIGLEGMMQEKVKINMKTSDFILAPRLYNAFDKDIKEIYNTLNELLVAKNISQR